MKKIASLFILPALLGGFMGCKKNAFQGPALDLNADVLIKSFSVGTVEGTINDSLGTISLVFPFGQDRSAVTPAIALADGATVSPASGTTVDLTSAVEYTVINGNLSNEYTVTSSEEEAIVSFVVDGVTATIDNTNRTITAAMPAGTGLAALSPVITLADGASISPASGETVDFTNPVTYKVTMDSTTVDYTVTISIPETVGFLSIASSASELTNPDEKAAWEWLENNNPEAEFISFSDIESGSIDLSSFSVLWWHEDSTQSLPAIATNATVLSSLKTYYADGGSFLLTTYAALYVESLGIVPSGYGPNNAFGDSRGSQWTSSDSWGISFYGHESHAAFDGLTLTSDESYATAYLLGSGTYRLNHTTQWYIPDWGGYSTPANWRTLTGGIDLGSSEGDEYHTSTITMAEFSRTSDHGAAIVIGAGCYDWYAEADPSDATDQPANIYLSNIEKLTSNVLEYLSK
ncbi:DUF4960 domain-containing protein [Parafilimonas sp.]|uniref:DUF4960 domain-containing protein n=1 Tax=Parafilimonas sp. TaxID=1969739 RepID=UPI0039E4F867